MQLLLYIDGETTYNGIIIPNAFPYIVNNTNKVINSFGNKTFTITKKIIRNFVTVDSSIRRDVSLRSNRRFIYDILSYIITYAKFNTNLIVIRKEYIDFFTNSTMSKRDYLSAIEYFRLKGIIARTNIQSTFAINPIAIYKGDLYKFDIICKKYIADYPIIKDNKIIVDRVAIIKDKDATDIEVINCNNIAKKAFNDVSKRVDFSIKLKPKRKAVKQDKIINATYSFKKNEDKKEDKGGDNELIS